MDNLNLVLLHRWSSRAFTNSSSKLISLWHAMSNCWVWLSHDVARDRHMNMSLKKVQNVPFKYEWQEMYWWVSEMYSYDTGSRPRGLLSAKFECNFYFLNCCQNVTIFMMMYHLMLDMHFFQTGFRATSIFSYIFFINWSAHFTIVTGGMANDRPLRFIIFFICFT